ncbi:hypothetical protein ACFVYT_26575 [Streptomyces sp. NPDC058290]|uniref:hypothetical protein n=1 Tax=Streptomyces sp. NPDC058290 TaxID=3346426 RepID=UPI0036E538D3
MYSGISVAEVATPALFTGSAQSPAQVVRLRIRRERPAGPLYVTVHGPGVATSHPRILRADTAEAWDTAGAGTGAPVESTVEVAVRTGGAAPGAVPGTYWMLVKAACQGRIAYGPAIAVRVSGVPDVPQG